MSTATIHGIRPEPGTPDFKGLVGVLCLVFIMACAYAYMFLTPPDEHVFARRPVCHCRCCERGSGEIGDVAKP